MPWTRLDDGFHQHPKILALSDAAHRLYVDTLNWAVGNLTDGRVPDYLPNVCLPHGNLKTRRAAAGELVAAGLWTLNGNGWVIHDFNVYQETKEEVQARREKWSNRKRSMRDSTVDSTVDTTQDTPMEAARDPVRTRVPIPIPKEAKASTQRNDETQTNREGVWTALEDLFGEAAETERKLRGKVVRSIIGAGGTFTEVKKRAGAWPKLFPRGSGPPLTLTATALEKWWGQLGLIVETGQPPPDCAICGNRRLVGITSEGEVVSVELEHAQVRQCSCVGAK